MILPCLQHVFFLIFAAAKNSFRTYAWPMYKKRSSAFLLFSHVDERMTAGEALADYLFNFFDINGAFVIYITVTKH